MSDRLRLRLRRIPKGNIIAQAADEIRRLVRGNNLPKGPGSPRSTTLPAAAHQPELRSRGPARSRGPRPRREDPGQGRVRAQAATAVRVPTLPAEGDAGGGHPSCSRCARCSRPRCADSPPARRAGRREIAALESELQSLREALSVDDSEGAVDADSRFHLALARGSRNEVLVDLLQSLNAAATENRCWAMPFYNDERLFRLHERILQAVRRGDPKAARASVEDHMRAIQNVETVLAKGGLDG